VGGLLLTPLSALIVAMPFFAMQSWYGEYKNYFTYFYIIISVILVSAVFYYVDKKKEINISLYYGLGIAYLLFPAMLCIFCTPIFARLLYVPGAFLLFMAFRKEARDIEEKI